ncbi:MAG: radical SAM protein, partial [Deltaproteobacteria bacterium]|nr:radical SAM protein [Deltaproteobacteria bacterium]
MLNYDWPLYRPPSEARSLIFQATLGCTHNKRAFCINYTNKRYRVTKEAEPFAEIDLMARAQPLTRRVFLADGDAFALRPERMVRLLGRLHEKFPALERITAYA